MRRIEGETLGRRMRGANAEQAQSFLRQFAELLARLHALECTRFADAKTGTDVEASLDAELAWYGQTLEGLEVPAFQPVWQWLRTQRRQLKPIRASLTHNNYHPYNVMVDRDGGLHLLDWTLARVTDPRSDLAQTFQLFTAAGFGTSREPITAAYEAAAGYRVEPMDFFEVFAALKHAAGQLAVLDDGKQKRPVLWQRRRAVAGGPGGVRAPCGAGERALSSGRTRNVIARSTAPRALGILRDVARGYRGSAWGGAVASLALFVLGCSSEDGAGIGLRGGSGGASSSTGTSGVGGGAGSDSGTGAGGDMGIGPSGGGGGGASGGGAGGGGGSEPAGPDACGNTNHASGTRVRLRMAVTVEGDTSFQGLHDTLLDVDCRYQVLDLAGNARCLPPHWTYFDMGFDTVFTDASCTDALYSALADCPPEALLVQGAQSDECAAPSWELFTRGEEHATSGTFYRWNVGQCEQVTAPIAGALYRKGAELDLEQYAAGTLGRWSEGGGVAVEGVIGADGSHEASGFVDTAQDRRCDVMKLEDGDEHCVAAQNAYREFGDAACAAPVITTYTPCGPDVPGFAFMASPTVCGANALYRVLGAHDGTVYGNPNDACVELDAAMFVGNMLHATELADPDAVPQLDRVVDDADPGRLRRIQQRNPAGACLFAGLHDTQLDVRCTFETAADGELRCVPVVDEPGETFSDTACTVEARYVHADPCDASPPRYAVVRKPAGCGYTVRVHHLDQTPIAMADLPTLYRQDIEGNCVVAAFSEGMHYHVGEELSPSEMISATLELR